MTIDENDENELYLANTLTRMEPCIIIHGGSRTIFDDDKKETYRQGVQMAARKGYELLLEVLIGTRGSQSIKIDTGKSFDKSISIDKLNLNDIDFIGQSIKFDTHTPTKC